MSEKITFETEDGDIELYVLEQTTLFGVNYILVTDDEESEDGSFFVLVGLVALSWVVSLIRVVREMVV